MLYFNLQEASWRLQVSDKTLRRWIKQARIEHKIDHGKYLIPESAVASIVARKETAGGNLLAVRIEALESRLNAIESSYAAISERLNQMEQSQQHPTQITATLRPARAEYTPMPDEHSGLVPYFRFYHGVPVNTAKRLMEVAGVTVIRGHWIDAGHHYDKALDAEGRRLAYLALHNHPRFQPCDACPH